MRAKRIIVASLLIAVAACSTAAESEMSRITAEVKKAMDTAALCASAINNKPEYSRISDKLALRGKRTLQHMSDNEFPSDVDVGNILDNHRQFAGCREIRQSSLSQAHPAFAAIDAKYAAKTDAVLLSLIRSEMAYGEANQKLQTIKDDAIKDLKETFSSVASSLQAQHDRELSQRALAAQAAADALMEMGQNLQAIERQRQQYNSSHDGKQINCSTIHLPTLGVMPGISKTTCE